MNPKSKHLMLLLAFAAMSHDVVQASVNAWETYGDCEVVVLNVTEENAIKVIKEFVDTSEYKLFGIVDASVMPLRFVPTEFFYVPFIYANNDDRHILPFMASRDELMTNLNSPGMTSVQELKLSIASVRGHSIPFETEWPKDCLLLPIASKRPNEQLMKEFMAKKYFIRFKPSCVSEQTIRMMRELFPSHEKVDAEKDAPEVPASEEGEKKDEEEV